jgi:hypothetical protein
VAPEMKKLAPGLLPAQLRTDSSVAMPSTKPSLERPSYCSEDYTDKTLRKPSRSQ